jgi:hypothetical protein
MRNLCSLCIGKYNIVGKKPRSQLESSSTHQFRKTLAASIDGGQRTRCAESAIAIICRHKLMIRGIKEHSARCLPNAVVATASTANISDAIAPLQPWVQQQPSTISSFTVHRTYTHRSRQPQEQNGSVIKSGGRQQYNEIPASG